MKSILLNCHSENVKMFQFFFRETENFIIHIKKYSRREFFSTFDISIFYKHSLINFIKICVTTFNISISRSSSVYISSLPISRQINLFTLSRSNSLHVNVIKIVIHFCKKNHMKCGQKQFYYGNKFRQLVMRHDSDLLSGIYNIFEHPTLCK